MSEATIIVKTFLRPWKAYHCAKTILANYTDRVIVADDSGTPYCDEVDYDGDVWPSNVRVLRLPFDVGLSAGRNRAVEQVGTEYVIVFDDDFFLDDLHPFVNGVPYFANSGLDVMGFCLKNPRFDEKSRYENLLIERHGVLTRRHGNLGLEGEHLRVDMCFNCFIARKDFLMENPWDEKMKLKEHWEFFWRIKKKGAKVGIWTEGHVMHGQLVKTNARYAKYRRRGREFMAYGLKKHNLKRYDG